MSIKKPKIKLKPWGREIWFAHTKDYAGKILEIKKGERISLQYHDKKEETMYILHGKAKFTVGESEDKLKEIILGSGEVIHFSPKMIHRAEAIKDTIIFEVSTADLDDVIKLHDDYGRMGEGNNEKTDIKLAKERKHKSILTNKTTKKLKIKS